jgi:hypothetical protein
VLVATNRRLGDGEATAQALNVRSMATLERLADAVQREGWPQPQRSLRRDGWALERSEALALMEKLRCSGKPLGEYVGGRFYYGIKTGLNEAFVVDQATRDRLVAKDSRSAEIIKPWLGGRDIERWRVEWDNKYLIVIQNSRDRDAHSPWANAKSESKAKTIFSKTYPAVYKHLRQYEARLKKRSDQGKFWWELRPCEYYAEFSKPKIIYPDIAKEPEFAYDTTGAYGGNTTYILPTNELYLLGVLNSSVVEFFYNQISSTIRGDYLRFIATYMEQVPIPDAAPAQRAAIEALVRKLLDAEGQGPQVAEWERELNALVVEVYGLSEEEMAIVKGV